MNRKAKALLRARQFIEDLANKSKKYRWGATKIRWEANQIMRHLPTEAQIMAVSVEFSD